MILVILTVIALDGAKAQSGEAMQADMIIPGEVASWEGADVYAASCSVCHGATGLGLAEAKQAFPADHRDCRHCHKVGNPATMNLMRMEMNQHDLFDIGDPPALRGKQAMAAQASPEALRAYISAAMPRYRPGGLSEEEYEAVTEFLLALNGR